MAFGKKNVLSTNPLSYNLGLIGLPGIGKTTTIKEYCEILAPEEGGYLFVECGKEGGADAIEGINYINCPDWNGDYDELNNSVGFQVLVDDILENKETEYKNLKVIVVDTYDQLKAIADVETVRRYNKEAVKDGKPKVNSIRAAYGGFARGEDMSDDMILDTLWSLKTVGVHFIVIGHIKQKDITDAITEQTYTQLTTDMSSRAFNKIKNKLDVLGVACIDREIIDLQKKEKLVGKKKVEVEVGKIGNEVRKITFRDDNYAVDSKSRFANIAPEIPLNGQALVDAMKDAIKAEIESKCHTVASAEKATAKKEKALKETAATASTQIKDDKRKEDLKEEIQAKFMSASADTKKAVKAYMAEHGIASFKDVSNVPVEQLEEIVAMVA